MRRSIAVVGVMSCVLGAVLAFGAPASVAQPNASGPVAGTFHGVTPARLLDTRINLGAFPPAANGVAALQVAGRGGVPGTGVAAVALNVTVTAPARAGYVTVFPDGAPAPTAANVNFAAGQTVSNLVLAKLSADGVVDLINRSPGGVQLVADVTGYYLSGTATEAGTLTPLTPARILDTRIKQGGVTVPSHSRIDVQVEGRGGVPVSGAGTAVLNVTVPNPAVTGSLTVYPSGAPRPAAPNVSFRAGETLADLVYAQVGADGKAEFYNGASTPVQVVADVMGYTVAAGQVSDPGAFIPVPSTHLLDTRTGVGGHTLAGHDTLRLQVGGRGLVPATSLRAVVLSVTSFGTTLGGYITAFPDGFPRPTTASLNFAAGKTTTNLVVVPVGSNGVVDLFNGSLHSTELTANAVGYYLGVFGEPAANCVGLANATGITNSTITIANASDVTGPVPDLYLSAQQATQAYAAYFNSFADICGRSLDVEALDTQTSSAGDSAAATTACADAFAMVGSLSLFDNGGAATAAGCGIPDVRARPFTAVRRDFANSFAVSYPDLGSAPAVVPQYFAQLNPTAAGNAAMLWINAGSFPNEASTETAAWTTSGFSFKYSQGIDVTTFDYTPIVTQLINHGVQYVQFDGPTQYAVRLAQALKAQSFSPIFVVGSLTGDVPFDTAGGTDVEGAYRFTDLLQVDGSSREYQLYVHWLHVVAPDAVPTAAGEYAWSAALLFTQRAMALGGQLSRATLTTSLGQTTTWTGDGMQWTETVNAKKPSGCATISHLTSGIWHGVGGGCGALITPPPPPSG